MEKITLKTIAKRLNLSPSTVSRVLRNDATCYIAKNKKEAIFRMVEEFGYTPNFSARNLILGQTSNIGFVLCNLSHLEEFGPFTFEIINGAQKVLKKENYILSIVSIQNDLDSLKNICSANNLYDGLIFGSGVIPKNGIDIIKNSKIPLIVIDDNSRFLSSIPRVMTDKQKGIMEAISYLKDLGHKKIAFYGYITSLQMFKNAMIKNGLTFDENLLFILPYKNIYSLIFEGYLNSEPILKKISKFSAILCSNDFVAIGLCERLKAKGIKVGKDIGVIGFDNVEELLNIKEDERFLTTIHKPRREMGKMCAHLLLRMIKDKNKKIKVEKLSCRLIVRKST